MGVYLRAFYTIHSRPGCDTIQACERFDLAVFQSPTLHGLGLMLELEVSMNQPRFVM